MLVLPWVVTEEFDPGDEIAERGLVGCRGFGLPACNHIQFSKLELLPLQGNQSRSSIEVVYDLEYPLFELARGRAEEEHPADSEVCRCALAFRNERIGRLLDAVVKERVAALLTQDETCARSLPQRRVHRFLCFLVYQSQGRDIGDVPEAGE